MVYLLKEAAIAIKAAIIRRKTEIPMNGTSCPVAAVNAGYMSATKTPIIIKAPTA